MKITDSVKYKIDKFEKGYVFTYDDFDIEINEGEALKKCQTRKK